MATTTQPAFDEQEFLERVGSDYKLAADAARLFLDDCPRRVTAMQEALESLDASALRSEAHGLKGSAGNMSAYLLSVLARDIEESAGEGRLDTARAMMGRLAAQAEAVLEAVRAFEVVAARR